MYIFLQSVVLQLVECLLLSQPLAKYSCCQRSCLCDGDHRLWPSSDCVLIPAKCNFTVGGVHIVVTGLGNIYVASTVVCVMFITDCRLARVVYIFLQGAISLLVVCILLLQPLAVFMSSAQLFV